LSDHRKENLTAKIKPRFIEPMLLLRTEKLPEGPEWGYEIKLDGYRALAFKTGGKLFLRSRNDNDFAPSPYFPQLSFVRRVTIFLLLALYA